MAKFTTIYRPNNKNKQGKEDVRYYINGKAVTCDKYGKRITKMFKLYGKENIKHENVINGAYKTTLEWIAA